AAFLAPSRCSGAPQRISTMQSKLPKKRSSPQLEKLEERLTLSSPGSLLGDPRLLVTSYYQDCLGRSPTDGEIATLANQLAAGTSLHDAVNGIVASPEALRFSIEEAYEAALGRQADAGGLASFTAARVGWMSHGQLLNELFRSAECNQLLPDN